MSARSRVDPWFRPRDPQPITRLRWWALCHRWALRFGGRALFAATRPATVTDIPEDRVQRVLR